MTLVPTSTQPRPATGLKGLIIRHPLVAFFVLAFGLSWSFLIADALGYYGLIPFRLTLSGPGLVLALIMSYGPTFAALIVTWVTAPATGIRALLARLLPKRAGLHWYVIALAGPAVLAFAAGKLKELLGASLSPLPAPLLQVIPMMVVGSVIHAIANGEEIGWRGYALPRLQERHSALHASLILGAIWWAFHIPIMFAPGSVAGSQSFDNALPFLVEVMAISVVVTWIFNSTRGSLLPIILLHGAMNEWPRLFAATGGSPAEAWIQAGLVVLLAAAVVLVYGPARLSRKLAAELQVQRDTSTMGLTGRTYAEANRRA